MTQKIAQDSLDSAAPPFRLTTLTRLCTSRAFRIHSAYASGSRAHDGSVSRRNPVTPDAPKCNSTFPSASLPLRSKSVLFGELIGHDGKNEILFVNWKGVLSRRTSCGKSNC
jgi:hypothetical protein